MLAVAGSTSPRECSLGMGSASAAYASAASASAASATSSSSSPSTGGSPALQRRRRRQTVQVACSRCRRSKKRCDAQRPTCSPCWQVGASCVYDTRDGLESRKDALQRHAASLQAQLDTSAERLRWLQSLSDADATALLQLVRSAADPMDMLQTLHAGMLEAAPARMTDTPSERLTIAASLRPDYSLLDLEFAAQHPSCYAPPQTMMPRTAVALPSPAPAADSPNSPSCQPHWDAELCDPRLESLNIGYWTTVPIHDHLAALLISTYLRTDHPVYGLFDPELFLEDLCDHRLRFCSPLLVNTILFWACTAYWPVYSAAQPYWSQFFAKAKMMLQGERNSDSLLNVASLAVLSSSCVGIGEDHLSKTYIVKGVKMGERLALFGEIRLDAVDLGIYLKPWLSAYSWVAWGAFNCSVMHTLYYRGQDRGSLTGKPPLLPIPGDYSFDANAPGPSFSHLSPSSLPQYMSLTFPALCKHWVLVHEVEYIYYDTKTPINERVPLAFAEEKFLELLAWCDNLPHEVARGQSNQHHVSILHICFHAFIMDIFRPFLGRDLKLGPLGSHSSRFSTPEAVFDSSAKHLYDLAANYYSRYQATPATHMICWMHAPLSGFNAVMASGRGRPAAAEVSFYIRSCKELLQSYPCTDQFIRACLSMAVSRGVLTSQEAVESLQSIRPPESAGSRLAGEAGWMTDLGLALVEPDAAVPKVLAHRFDDLALDQG